MTSRAHGASLPAHSRAAAEAVGAKPGDLGHDIAVSAGDAGIATVGEGRAETFGLRLTAFDGHHAPARDLIDDCVHCGFCLPTCPTYVLWGEEMDSPRGRIYLMNQALEGEPLTATMVRHWDLCLGCLACVTACPSGVQYEKLIESTRQQVERRYPRAWPDRLMRRVIFALFPYPRRLSILAAGLGAYQRYGLDTRVRASGVLKVLPPPLQAAEALAPEVRLGISRRSTPALTPARGTRRARVGLLTGCVQRAFFGQVNTATIRVLAAEGCEVVAPPGQGCCGALSAHAGREEEAIRFARGTIDVFDEANVEAIVVNSAGCGSAMKHYDYLLRDDHEYAERARRFASNVRDVSEFLQELGPVAPRQPLQVTAAYHDACHLSHGQGVRSQPRDSLRVIPGLVLRELREAEICCGSAGIYNLVEPEPARDLGDRKAASVLATGAELLVASNPGCTLQIQAALARRGERLAMAHPVEVLDASIRGESAERFLTRKTGRSGPGSPDHERA